MNFRKILITICTLILIITPFLVSAEPLFDPNKGLVGGVCNNGQCGFNDIVGLINRLVKFVFYVSVPIAALLFAYAGFLFLTAGPNAGQADRAKGIFTNVAVGFIIILSAYLIVYTVTNAIIEDGFLNSLPVLGDLKP
ncbi:MAG: Type secretion system pilin [Candidatus Parcubacteria bacterium]|jgi:hypothetical protein